MMRDKLKDKMTEVSDYIFQHPELSKHEEQSSRALADFLEQEGFTVKWELAGFRTAFVAEWGSGQPIIGFLAEYDALPGLAQEPVSRHCPKEGPGHGCGHNLLGTACAGAAIYRREVFETIGYFDEMHFAYLEDIDVGYRAKLYGYDNVFCPEAVVYHVGSGTSGSKYNSFKVKLAARNNVYLNYKNMRTWQLLLNSPCLLAGTFVKFLFFKKMGFGKDYVSGFLEGIRTLKNCKRVPSFKGRIQREIGIQLELIAGTAVYIYEFSRRQAAKLGAKV